MAKSKDRIIRNAIALSKRYANDPIGWIEKFINFKGLRLDWLTSQQEEIAQNLVKYKNICVSSGTGVGKSAIVAILIQWFLITHPMCKIPTTAPSSKQLNNILWNEISIWLERNRLKDMYEFYTSGKLCIKNYPEWYSIARTVPKDRRQLNDTLAGFHGQSGVLICVDEASGVPDPVFTALAGAMTDRDSYIILISNPVSTGGFYYDTITDPQGKGKDFKVMFYSALESPLVDKAYEEFVVNRWGKESPMYKAKVLGLPFSEYDTVVVSPDVFDEVVAKNKSMGVGQYILSGDVGGGGPDLTVLMSRCGNSVYKWEEFPRTDPTFVADLIESRWATHFAGKLFSAVIDAQGIGAGTYSNLAKSNKFPVVGFIGPQKSSYPEMYDSKRVEGFHLLHKNFQDLHFPVPPPERLKKELANLRFEYGEGAIKMEPKKNFKQRLGFSPDYADTLMMSEIAVIDPGRLAGQQVPRGASNVMAKLRVTKRHEKYGRFGKFVS